MIASLAMYDWPGQSAYWDQFWHAIRDSLRQFGHDAPDELTRGGTLWDHWQNPGLVLGQTCGLPYRSSLHGKVQLVGTLDHGLPGCPPGYYNSVIVARAEHPKVTGGTLAVNARDSQSGWAAPLVDAAEKGWKFSALIETGSHHASAIAVAQGRADMASLDAETWRLLAQYEPELAGSLTIVARTDPTPGLPLITGARIPAADVFQAVADGLVSVGPDLRHALHIKGLVAIPAKNYLDIPTPNAT